MAINVQTSRGTVDILPEQVKKLEVVEKLLKDFCLVYGYNEIRTPIFEDTKVFKRENDSSDMVNKEMYTFTINDKDYITLRPEGTASVVRSIVQNKMYANAELPIKLSYYGPMFRYERPQKGRQRQFHQFGIENIGIKSPLIDAETIAFGYSFLKALGINDIKVLINTLGDNESRENYKKALKDYLKPHLEGLCSDCQRRYEQNPLRILDCKIDKEHESMNNVIKLEDYLNNESKEYFNNLLNALDNLDIPYTIDSKLVRGLDYYSDTVFEIVSTHSESGSQSTILAGGRYDKLVEYFNGPSMSGIGFAMGMERLMILLDALDINLIEKEEIDAYIMTLGNIDDYGLQIATGLRANGFIVECNLIERSLKAQFKSVDRYNSKLAIIVGEEELKNDQVVVKNLKEKTQENVNIDQLIEYIDNLLNNDEHKHCNCEEDCNC